MAEDYSVKAVLSAVDSGFTSSFKAAIGTVKGLESTMQTVTSTVGHAGSAMKSAIGGIGHVAGSVKGLMSGMAGAVKSTLSSMASVSKSVLSGMSGAAKTVVSGMASSVKSIVSKMGSAVKSAFKGMASATKSILSGMASATKSAFSKLEADAKNSLNNIKGMITGLGTAITGLGMSSLKSFGDFQANLNKAAVVAGGTAKDIKGLADVANKMGKDLPLSANDAAQAMVGMAQNGADLNMLKETFPAIAKASTAAGADISATASAVQQSLNIWGGSSARNAAILVQTANASNAAVDTMADAFANVGTTAKSLGLDLSTVSESIGLLTNKGMTTERASMDLNHALVQMVKPSKAAQKVMSELGVSYTDAQGRMKPFREILGELSDSLQSYTPAQQKAYEATLFGTAGMSAIAPLIDSVRDKTGNATTSWDAYAEKQREATGTISKANETLNKQANEMQKNVGSALEQVGGAWDDLKNQALMDNNQMLMSTLNMISKTLTHFKTGTDGLSKFVRAFIGIAPILGPVVLMLGATIASLGQIASLLNPFTLVIGAIGLFALKIVAAYRSSSSFRAEVNHIANVFKQVFGPVIQNAVRYVEDLIDALSGKKNGRSQDFASFGDRIAAGLRKIDWRGLFEGAKKAFELVINLAKSFVKTMIEIFKGINFSSIFSALSGLLHTLSNDFQQVVRAMLGVRDGRTNWEGLGNVITLIITKVSNLIQILLNVLTPILIDIIRLAQRFIHAFDFAPIISSINTIFGALEGLVDNLMMNVNRVNMVLFGTTNQRIVWLDILSAVTRAIVGILHIAQPVFNTLTNLIIDVIQIIRAMASAFRSISVQSSIGRLSQAFRALFTELKHDFNEIIRAMFGNKQGQVTWVIVLKSITDSLTNVLKFARVFLRTFTNIVAAVIKDARAMMHAFDSEPVKKQLRAISKAFESLVNGLEKDFKRIIRALFGTTNLQAVMADIAKAIANLLKVAKPVFNAITTLIVHVIKSAKDLLKAFKSKEFETAFGKLRKASKSLFDELQTDFARIMKALFGTSSLKGILAGITDGITKIIKVAKPAFNLLTNLIVYLIGKAKQLMHAFDSKPVKKSLSEIGKAFKPLIKEIQSDFKKIFTAIFGDKHGKINWNNILKGVTNAIVGILKTAKPVFSTLTDIIVAVIKVVKNFIGAFDTKAVKNSILYICHIIKFVVGLIKQFTDKIISWFKSILKGFKKTFDVKAFKKSMKDVGKALKDVFDIIEAAMGGKSGNKTYGGLGELLGTAANILADILSVAAKLVDALAPLIEAVIKFVDPVGRIVQFLKLIVDLAKFIVQHSKSFVNAIIKLIKQLSKKIAYFINHLPRIVKQALRSIGNFINNVFGSIGKFIGNAIKSIESALSGLGKFFSDLWKNIKKGVQAAIKWLADLPKNLLTIGKNLVIGLINGIVKKAKDLWKTITDIGKNIIKFFKSINLLNIGKAIMISLFNGVKWVWNKGKSFFEGVGPWIKQHKGPIDYDAQLLVPAGKAIMNGFGRGLMEEYARLQSWIQNINNNISGYFNKMAGEIRRRSMTEARQKFNEFIKEGAKPAEAMKYAMKYANSMQADEMYALNKRMNEMRNNMIARALDTMKKRTQAQLSSQVSAKIENANQPAYINLNLGGHNYRTFVSDITSQQDKDYNLEQRRY